MTGCRDLGRIIQRFSHYKGRGLALRGHGEAGLSLGFREVRLLIIFRERFLKGCSHVIPVLGVFYNRVRIQTVVTSMICSTSSTT